jgi:excinuclease ABC subunit A
MTNDVSPLIRLRGVRHNNLKNFDLDLPIGQLIVITGLSGSGKSSLAFDTLFAEGQRRYIETFSPYARQFFDRMDKPQVDRIDGIPPAIAIEQRNSVKTTRSTVGTMTELCDYLKVLWPHLARLYCRQCGQPVGKDSPQLIWKTLSNVGEGARVQEREVLVTFDVPLSEKLSLTESFAFIAKQGYQRILLDGEILRLEDATERLQAKPPASLRIVQDRLKISDGNRARFVEACEQAYHFGKGLLAVHELAGTAGTVRKFSNHFHCASCDIQYSEPSPALFSFNNPVGACPACRGFGRIISIDYSLALPDRSKTLAQGAIKPWQSGQSAECQTDLLRVCRQRKIPTDIPFDQLPASAQDLIINGDPDYGKDSAHEWPRAWYGIKGYFRWLESKSYKMHVRVLLSRYRAYSTCPECQGRRFKPDSLLFKVRDAAGNLLTLSDFYQLPVDEALPFIEQVASGFSARRGDPVTLALEEVRSRLGYLVEVGLGYLTLDRPTRSLSGGETERVNLTACLGTRLVNTLFVLDEPSVGLHARDTARLVRILERLRDTGNTVVVVEHEGTVIRAADQVLDLGPGQGEAGGHIVFQGPFKRLLKCRNSLTGQYLSGAKQIETPSPRPVKLSTPRLKLSGINRNNLCDLALEIPLNRFVCLTGVSGSGKTTLAREVLLPALEARFSSQAVEPLNPSVAASRESAAKGPLHTNAALSRDAATDRDGVHGDENATDSEGPDDNPRAASFSLSGAEHLGRIVLVDQSSLGKTPRSNPVVYIGAFEDVRQLFAQTELAQRRGLGPSAFSFNSGQGQCERCRGAGFEKIEMQFLSDVFIRCPDCRGRRYRAHILEVKLIGSAQETAAGSRPKNAPASPEWSIADLLEATVDDAVQFLLSWYHTPPGRRALQSLRLLQEVGLGYLRLGQPINTLSGGESQRLKLVSHLAEFTRSNELSAKPTVFLFDEPTTGLHFDDVRVLLKVFQRLVDAGHSLLVIEHNLDVIKSADWILDLGPEAGARGGNLVAAGTPREVAATNTHTALALRALFEHARAPAR